MLSIAKTDGESSFDVDFRKRTMKLGRAESVRVVVNKFPAQAQRHARVFAREAPYRIEYCIDVIDGLVHSCLSIIVSKNIVVTRVSPG